MRRSVVWLLPAVCLASPGLAQAGGKPHAAPAPHFQAPRMPQYQAPRMPQQHFQAAPRMQQPQPIRQPSTPKVKTPVTSQNQFRPNPPANGFNMTQRHTVAPHTTKPSQSSAGSASSNEIVQSLLPSTLAAGGSFGAVGTGARSSRGAHYGSGSSRGYRGPYRSSRPRNSVGVSSQEQARLRHLQTLVIDLDNLGPGTVVTDAHRNALRGDLMALAQGANRPDPTSVRTLASDLAGNLPQRNQRQLDTRELAGDLEVVVNGRHLPSEGVSRAINDAQAVLRVSGVGNPGVQALVTDMRAVGTGGFGLGAPVANNGRARVR